MKTFKINSYGISQIFEPKDKVRIWKIFKSPIGVIQEIVEFDANPIIYSVKYTYEDTGISYIENFESSDLTLVERGLTYIDW